MSSDRRRVSERTVLWTVFCTLTFFGLVAASPVGTVEVGWQPPGNEDVLAPKAGKPILYFFTADWCAPCHQLKRRVFRKAKYIDNIEAWYYPVEVKDTSREKGANLPEVNEAFSEYDVKTLPTLIVALPDGTEVARQTGFGGAGFVSRWLEKQHAEALSQMGEGEGSDDGE